MASLVQSASNTATSGTTVTVTLGSSATSNNCLVVKVGGASGSSTPSVSTVKIGGSADHFGSTAAKKQSATGADFMDCEIWVDAGLGVNSTSVVVTFAASIAAGMVYVEEWSGVLTSSAVDKTNSGSSSTSTFSSGSSGTLTQANEVVVGAVVADLLSGTPTLTGPSSPWTNLTQINAASQSLLCSYETVSATTAQTYTGSISGSNQTSGAVIVTLKDSTSSVTGTGTLALAALKFTSSGSETFSGTGHLALAPLHFSGTNAVTGTGTLGLAALKFAASGSEKFTGTGSLTLAPITFSGSQATVVPTIPVEPAGIIALSSDLNDWANACTFLLGSSKGTQPMFFFTPASAQTLTTSFAAITWSSGGVIFKDNNGGWSSGHPTRYTVALAGYYHIEWLVSVNVGAGNIYAYAQVTTGAGNPFNPSTTVQFQYGSRPVASSGNIGVVSNGGLVPIYLVAGDYIEVYVKVTTSQATQPSATPQMSGEWVSA
jgi:hypothetical protein